MVLSVMCNVPLDAQFKNYNSDFLADYAYK